ncbi:MAG: HD domain-containing protein [Magnetococcales bacterium]|nr:HD domain-containing protein [Magnetococcales bacterium]
MEKNEQEEILKRFIKEARIDIAHRSHHEAKIIESLIIEKIGCKTFCHFQSAHDCSEKYFSNEPPDLLILDFELGIDDGKYTWERLEKFLVTSPDINNIRPAILVLSDSRDIDRERKVNDLSLEYNKLDSISHLSPYTSFLIRVKKLLDAHAMEKLLASFSTKQTNIMIDRLAQALEYRDDETGNHVKRMAEYAALLGEKMGVSPEKIPLLRQATMLHDLGKIGVPDKVLLKPGTLDKTDRAKIEEHPRIGKELLDSTDSVLVQCATVAYCHHEKWDGSGYPDHLKGDAIPLWARIVAVVDVFDALTAKRPYKPGWLPEAALDLIINGKGTHFDPRIVDAFEEVYDKVLAIMEKYPVSKPLETP